MISHLLAPFDNIATSPLITTWGGMAVTAVKAIFDEKDELAASFSLPVSFDRFSTDCYDTGEALNLVPDNSKKGIAYLEIQGQPTFSPVENMSQKYKLVNLSIPVRLVMWFNLPLLGYTLAPMGLEYDVISKIRTPYIDKSKGIASINIVKRNLVIDDLFSKYTYDDTMKGYLGRPYYVAGIDFDVNCLISEKCVPSAPVQTALPCL